MRWLAGVVALAAATSAGAAVEIVITRPTPGEVIFGQVTITAEVRASEAVSRVSFLVDGRLVGEVSAPPFEVATDVGADNVEHRVQVIARTASGNRAEAAVVTGKIVIDQEVTYRLQQLYVSVMRGGSRVLDLEKDEFEIRDEGDRQEILTFARGDVPFTAVVLLDASLSMQGPRLAAAQEGARAFFSGMRGLDEGKLVLFSDRAVVSTPFTGVSDVLLAGISGAVAGGGTTLNDQLFLALKLLEWRQGRRVVVVLSDGLDAHSVLSASDVLLKARQSQALVYWIRLHEKASGKLEDLFSPWRDAAWYHQQVKVLAEVAEQSGGRVVIAEHGEIAGAFSGILRELREQYVLGYYPTSQSHDGRWRSVRVKVARDKVTVRARGGYLDL